MYRVTYQGTPRRYSRSLFGALRFIRDQSIKEQKHGRFREPTVEIRILRDGPWTCIPPADVNRYARDMRITGWSELGGAT